MEEYAQLFGADTLHLLEWPKTEDGKFVRHYFEPLIKHGVGHYFKNIDADLYILKCEDLLFPVASINVKASNSYVCSPYGHYISYALQNLHHIGNPFFRKLANGVISNFGNWLRSQGIESIVYVNNWLMGIDLYPEGITADKVAKITSLLKKRFPDSAIICRSIDTITNPTLHKYLGEVGYEMFATRHNYLADTKDEKIFQRRILKSDLKLLKETDYVVLEGNEITSDEFAKILDLYLEVYIKKHSELNPELTPSFVDLLFKQGLMSLRVLKRPDGTIDGAVGFYDRNGIFLCPFLGYDVSSPNHAVLYRLLSTILLTEARKKGLLFQAGAGGTFFKKIRFQKTCRESMAVYYKHLPFKRRLPWNCLKSYVNGLVYPMMKRY